ncbi:oligoendopeptidase F [Mycoplasmopsis gallinacea]|uniref:Oligopeptidase F n=1 Tax=Mycoplasmopsis gallinacea TaxID=29556 RepID=A0A0D5ZJP2_9BACT|nr:oligoendopeptidase F [Mycoplasmopsis gallinacea]
MEAKQYKNYQDIPKKYRWNLEAILENKTYQYWVDKYKELWEQKIAIKDSKFDNLASYTKGLKLEEELTLVTFKLHNYLSNNLNTNLVDPKFNKLQQEFDFLTQAFVSRFGSEENRIYAHKDKIWDWKEKPELKSYKRYLTDLLDSFTHKLSDDVEEYIKKTSFGKANLNKIFSILTNSELDFGTIELSKNKKVKLNPTNRLRLLKHQNKDVRKQAYQNFLKGYIKHKNSLSEVLYQHFKDLATEANVRKYDSVISMLTYEDKVSDALLNKLFSQVQINKKVLLKYKHWYKKFYKAKFGEKIQIWDWSRDLITVDSDYSVEKAKELVENALKPFGSEYMNQIHKALNENWVDFMSADSKRGGAYSIGSSYGIDKKYILMNFNGQLRGVETLAHELGHSMHSYYSDTRQDLINSQYPIFLAEIASIFNELMLYDYLLQKSDNDKLKFSILTSMINGFIATVMRQVEWANYEYDLYKGIEEGTLSSSFDSLSKLYYQNSLKYTLERNVKYNDETTIFSIYVPHFYYGFYVYKYAIGQLVASYFFAQYKAKGTSALENYIDNFLSAGNSDYPIEILKKVGVNLENDQFYKQGFDYVEKLIDQWVKIGKKIFKFK